MTKSHFGGGAAERRQPLDIPGDGHGVRTVAVHGWRAFGLKPHLVETWKLSTDPQFVDKEAFRKPCP
jgi:hypothetical protein